MGMNLLSVPFHGINFAPFPHRGVLSQETTRRSLCEMAETTGANWVIFSPAGVQADPYSEAIDRQGEHTPDDTELIDAIRRAKALGLRVALKPTVNCLNGVWRARISFFDHDVPCESQWGRWFASYTAFQTHFADIAQAEGCELFLTGCEMTMTEHRESEWRALLAEVRRRYTGLLSYNCDKYGEDHVAWWDAADLIASSGYYPLHSWPQQLARIEATAQKFGKPVLFSEAGCMNVRGSAAVPNNWEIRGAQDDAEQAAWYADMFAACADKPWVWGHGLWDWPADPEQPSHYAVSRRAAGQIIADRWRG